MVICLFRVAFAIGMVVVWIGAMVGVVVAVAAVVVAIVIGVGAAGAEYGAAGGVLVHCYFPFQSGNFRDRNPLPGEVPDTQVQVPYNTGSNKRRSTYVM
jgi:hypothetical protein